MKKLITVTYALFAIPTMFLSACASHKETTTTTTTMREEAVTTPTTTHTTTTRSGSGY